MVLSSGTFHFLGWCAQSAWQIIPNLSWVACRTEPRCAMQTTEKRFSFLLDPSCNRTLLHEANLSCSLVQILKLCLPPFSCVNKTNPPLFLLKAACWERKQVTGQAAKPGASLFTCWDKPTSGLGWQVNADDDRLSEKSKTRRHCVSNWAHTYIYIILRPLL